MKLQVQNLGPIKFGEIDLSKRFYVFVGYNNSGKTYMGQLLWSIFNLDNLNSFKKTIELSKYEKATLDKPFLISEEMLNSIINDFNKFSSEKFIRDTLHLDSKHFLNKNLSIKIDKNSICQDIINKDFKLGLGLNTDHENFMKLDISISIDDTPLPKKEKPTKEKQGKEEIFTVQKKIGELEINFHPIDDFDKSDFPMTWGYEGDRSKITAEIVAKISLELIFPFSNFRYHTFFLPANRNFYPNFYKYIYSASKAEKDAIGHELGNGANLERIKTLAKRPYTQPMDELNTRIFNLNNNRTPTGHHEDLLIELEEIIGGKIEVISVEGIAPIEFRLKIAEGKSLDMHVASSSSNQLTTLYLYLKYWARESNNFLILDEPEENLHPKNQLKLLELLIKFSKRNNNRILITTHSTLLSDSINNHLHLGHLKKEGFDLEEIAKDKKLHIDVNAALEPDETGVYFFSGERIFEYGVEDYGVVFGDFVQEEHKVRNDGSALRDIIYESQNEKRRQKLEKTIEERKLKLEETKDA